MRFGHLNGGMSQDSFIKLIHFLDKCVCLLTRLAIFYYFILSQIKYLLNVFSV